MKKNTQVTRPPFGYFGSKNKMALHLCEKLPPHNCWVEAFCGSAAVTLRKEPAPIEVINDIDSEIINFFEQLRTNSEKLCEQIRFTPYSEEELSKARIKKNGLDNLEKARRFLVQSMMAINGIFGEQKGGFSYSDSYVRGSKEARVSRWNNLPERLDAVVERLRSIRIENKDARRVLKRYIYRPATLVYLDPPYYADRTNGYRKDANNKEFHAELLELANLAHCMIFISGYDNELYNAELTTQRGWTSKRIKASTKDASGKVHEREEVIWMNKYFSKALESNELPIVLTKREIALNKLNPIRKNDSKRTE